MSHPNTESPKSGSLMEDVISIFVKPSVTFEHQRNNSFVMPALVQSLLFLVMVFALKNLTQPFFDAEQAKVTAKMMAKMAEAGREVPAGGMPGQSMSGYFTMIGTVITPWFIAIIGGLFGWLGARLAGAKISYGQAAMIASWSAFPMVIGYMVIGVMGVVMDTASITGINDAQIGPARFVTPTTPAAIEALFRNLDVFSLWSIVLAAIGVSVVGRVSMGTGIVASIIKWAVVVLLSMIPAVLFS